MSQAEAVRTTGLSSQLISQIVNRKKRYTRPPKIDTLQKLARIPGLSLADVARAVAASTGYPVVAAAEPAAPTGLRRSVHNLVDEFPDDRLSSVLQVLLAMRD